MAPPFRARRTHFGRICVFAEDRPIELPTLLGSAVGAAGPRTAFKAYSFSAPSTTYQGPRRVFADPGGQEMLPVFRLGGQEMLPVFPRSAYRQRACRGFAFRWEA